MKLFHMFFLLLFMGMLPLSVGDVSSHTVSSQQTLPFIKPDSNPVSKLSLSTASGASTAQVSPALLSFEDLIAHTNENLAGQGIQLERLDGGGAIASLNADQTFNPASLTKIATSLAALEKFGPDYHLRTSAFAEGEFNPATRTITGDLIIDGDGDPLFYTTNAQILAQSIARAGVSHVTGDLIIKGALSINRSASPDSSAQRMFAALRGAGIRFGGGIKFGVGHGGSTLLVTHESGTPLKDVLLFQNAHSDNPIAERIGDAIGGPEALRQYLINSVGIAQDEVYFSRTSGLDYNRISPRGMVQVLRHLLKVLADNQLKPEDLLPVAGVDAGTLSRRFRGDEWQGAVIGKTGSLPGTDGGVSTLAGIAYTRNYGPVLYAIFNTGGSVRDYRRLQDSLLENFIVECGGPQPTARVENGLDREIRLEPLVHIVAPH